MEIGNGLLAVARAAVFAAAFVTSGAAAAPPWLQLSVERKLIPVPGAQTHKADFTVTWDCGLFCKEIDYYNIRWGREGGAETQSEIPRNREKWSTTLTEPGANHVFKLQSCTKPDFSIGPFRPGGSSCSKWSEVKLQLPAPPSNLRAADESDPNAAKFEHRYRLEWQPGAGLTSQELVTSSDSQREPTRRKIDSTARETVVTLEPGKSAKVRVCGLAPSYTLEAKSSGHGVLGCTSFAELRGVLPPPRKPKIGPARNLGRQVRVDWEATDNFTERYEIERLHWESPNRAVRQAPDPQTSATTQRRGDDLRPREGMPLSKAPARPQPRQTAGSDRFVWVKTFPISQGYAGDECNEYLMPGYGPTPSRHCMRDDPSKYARERLGAPITPYQYRVCALNRSGRTCSDFIEVPALYEAVTQSAAAVQPPSLGSTTTARARSDVPILSPGTPAVRVSPGVGLDGSGRVIAPGTQRPPAVAQQPPNARAALPPAGRPQDKQPILRPGMEANTNRNGSDYRSFESPAGPEQCQQACAKEGQCRAWTWVVPGVQGPKGMCWLKNAVPAAIPNQTCCVSGIRAASAARAASIPARVRPGAP